MKKYNLNLFDEELQTVSVRIQPSLYKQVKLFAAENDMTISDFINDSLIETLLQEGALTMDDLKGGDD